ncbi:MAG: hypothetical protein NTY57_05015 [Solirubrobacterales bacterium]|nr:hypothetical protein [Solirubrobacterales bacterium]MSW87627.1 hypothetical protein [Actinomycetota bacterium]
MRIDYALLADGAIQRPDGKLDIYGAGWDFLTAQSFPHAHGSFDVALRLVVPADEVLADHVFELIVQGPDGEEVARTRTEMVSQRDRDAIDDVAEEKLTMTFNFRGVVFPTPGPYQLVMVIDENEIHAVEFSVLQVQED